MSASDVTNLRKSKKLAAYAAAAAAASFVHATSTGVVAADTPKTPSTRSIASKGIHATLWGSSCADNDDGGRDLLAIPRGGTDESQHPQSESEAETEVKPASSRKKKENKQKRNKKNKKEKEGNTEADNNTQSAEHSASSASSFSFNKSTSTHNDTAAAANADASTETATTDSASHPSKQHATTPKTNNHIIEEILSHEDYYEILGLPRGEDNASKIKKAYRRRAVQTHPDKTEGDRRAFDKLAEAYDVLLDDDKRALYNRFGKDGLDPTKGGGGGPGGMMGAEDLFRSFFGGRSPFSQQQGSYGGPTVNRNLKYQLEVTLEDLYRGMSRRVTVEAPSMMMGFHHPYHHKDSKDVNVSIPRGSHAGQSIVLSGEMDFDSKDSPPGDLVFQLHQRPHRTFTRKGHDLAMEMTISFQEAICGCTRTIRHLDGRELVLESAKHTILHKGRHEESNEEEYGESPPNVYIQTGDVQVVKGQGMPKNAQGTEFGDLYVQYAVELPKSGSTEHLSTSERIELARLLEKLETGPRGHKKQNKLPKGGQAPYTLQKASVRDFGRASGPVPSFEDDEHLGDEHDHGHHHHSPFGAGHRQFFWSSNTGRSPFFGQENDFGSDDEHVQCRQM